MEISAILEYGRSLGRHLSDFSTFSTMEVSLLQWREQATSGKKSFSDQAQLAHKTAVFMTSGPAGMAQEGNQADRSNTGGAGGW
jgi:hypothetical protein